MSSREFNSMDSGERGIILEHQREIPVKLSVLAKALGLRVMASTLPTGTSGELRPNDHGFVISVNRHDSPKRQRFTVAHEIAHYLLHRNHIDGGIRDDVLYRSGLSDSREAEANRLAADILMPRSEVERLRRNYQYLSHEELVTKLSEEFNVSEVAMKIRLGLL